MHEYVTTMIVLVGVIVSVVLLVFLLKKTMPSRFIGSRHIKIIEQLSLGSKERLVLISINNKDTILIGVTAQSMSTLHVCDDIAIEIPQEFERSVNRPRI